jgi:hypothetical protein
VIRELSDEAIRTLTPAADAIRGQADTGPTLMITMSAGNAKLPGLVIYGRFRSSDPEDVAAGHPPVTVEVTAPTLVPQAGMMSSAPRLVAPVDDIIDALVRSAFGPNGATFVMTDSSTGRELAGMVMFLRVTVERGEGYVLTPHIVRMGDRELAALLARERIISAAGALGVKARLARSATPDRADGIMAADALLALCEPWSSRLREALAADRSVDPADLSDEWILAKVEEWSEPSISGLS